MQTISDKLFEKLTSTLNTTTFPEGIIKNEKQLKGTAFFPGGKGIYKANSHSKESFPIMILGHDYDNECNFHNLYGTDHQSEVENKNQTWTNLLKIFRYENININPEDCFFTNAIMGLRKGDTKNTGVSKAFSKSNKEFLLQNVNFFKFQLDIIKPKLIIGLGSQIPRFIGQCFNENDKLNPLLNIKSFKELDKHDNFCKPIKIEYNNSNINLVFITHPCMFFANTKKRFNGEKSELNLLKRALPITA